MRRKYNEIMDKIVVTEEMKQRILSGIGETELTESKKTQSISRYRRWLSFAACFVILLIGAIVLPKLLHSGTSPEVTDIPQIAEADSVNELSQAVGYEVRELAKLPFAVTDTVYTDYGDGLAEIDYIGEDQELCYRISPGTEDNSGDYNTYESEFQTNVNNMTVTFRGNQDLYQLAIWTDGTYAYSISLENGISGETFADLIRKNVNIP